MTLEQRMLAFLRAWPGAEAMDDSRQDGENADFVIADKLVIEVKNIAIDPTRKIPAVLAAFGIQVGEGRYDLEDLIDGRTDEQRIRLSVYDALFASIEQDIRKANRQIRNTKLARALPNAPGVLLLLNDQAADLHPKLLIAGLEHKLMKKSGGVPRFPSVSLVWLLSEKLPRQLTPIPRAFVGFVPNHACVPLPPWFRQYIEVMHIKWETQNGYPPRTAA